MKGCCFNSPWVKRCRGAEILTKLVEIHYDRNDMDFHRGTFRVRGDVIDVFPAYEDDSAIRIGIVWR